MMDPNGPPNAKKSALK